MIPGSLVSDARWKILVELLDEKFWVVPCSASPNEKLRFDHLSELSIARKI
jgi:hypothetical protein